MNRKKRTYDQITQGCSITEPERNFLDRTRLFTKKVKNWQGRSKPVQVKKKEEEEKETASVLFALKKIKSECPHCGESYKGSWEDAHAEKCKAFTDADKKKGSLFDMYANWHKKNIFFENEEEKN